jgi:hemoglobin-like flavoprotein
MSLNVEIIEKSFAHLHNNGVSFTEKFYGILLTDYPELQSLFANVHMEKQGQQLFQSLVFTVDNLQNPDILTDALKGLGTRHVKYGVLPQHYPLVGGSLLKTLEASLGIEWTPPVQQAWTDAYGVVAQLMLEGADYSPEQLALEN